jgi:uncharacterized protein (TIGR02145 family)
LAAGFGLALAFTLSCSGDDPPDAPPDAPPDDIPKIVYGAPLVYGGEIYQTIVIGSQTWMARNLNYNADGSKCFGNEEGYCAIYGRLYDWATAKTVCPQGWHLPSYDEWNALMSAVGGESTAGKKLKATSGWANNGNGTDVYGFSALPGGYGYSDGYFTAGLSGYWWSATENYGIYAYSRNMGYHDEGANWGHNDKDFLFSVRCLQD